MDAVALVLIIQLTLLQSQEIRVMNKKTRLNLGEVADVAKHCRKYGIP